MDEARRERRIAVVVIHGIGFQRPFETLDKVVEGVLAAAEETFGCVDPAVAVRQFADDEATPRAGYTSDFWERNYFEVTARAPAPATEVFRFTILEAYWGHRRETDIPRARARRWLIRRLAELDRARLFLCRRRTDNQTRLRLLDPAVPADGARLGAGDREIAPRLRRLLRWALVGAGLVGPFQGIVGRIVSLVYFGLLSRVRWQDVVAYITTDPQNPLYRVRGDILDEVEDRLHAIADWASNSREPVDGIVVVGHSLGSVILVDVINRMRRRPAGRTALAALEPKATVVLLGSPVEHVLRLVLLRMPPAQRFRNATTLLRVAWRLDPDFVERHGLAGIDGLEQLCADRLFTTVPVLNAHAYDDAISSEITVLEYIENLSRDYGAERDPHGRYWRDREIYARAFRAWRRHVEAPPPSV
jgi:hypothetical protein